MDVADPHAHFIYVWYRQYQLDTYETEWKSFKYCQTYVVQLEKSISQRCDTKCFHTNVVADPTIIECDEHVILWGKMFDCNRVIIGLDLGVGEFFWMNILLWIKFWIESFPGPIQWKMNFQKRSPTPKSSPIMTQLQSNIFPHNITSSSHSIIVGSAATFVWQHFVSQRCEIDFSNCTTYVWQHLKLFHSVS